ncbi:hypothetical protein PR048_032644 [Dryococelus australis]|uniref:Uncharacterized protein n=1 Tax=Dryococelus australis TaxID=614101 RepID=A0ABQ9G2S9_9NEOP|nr:hypothetical protein PR048_032644 [Dryococelus australis]
MRDTPGVASPVGGGAVTPATSPLSIIPSGVLGEGGVEATSGSTWGEGRVEWVTPYGARPLITGARCRCERQRRGVGLAVVRAVLLDPLLAPIKVGGGVCAPPPPPFNNDATARVSTAGDSSLPAPLISLPDPPPPKNLCDTLHMCRCVEAAVAERLDCSPPTWVNPGSRRVIPGFSQVGIVPDVAAGRQVFSGIFPPPSSVTALLHSYLISPSSALKTLLLRAALISQLNYTCVHAARREHCTPVHSFALRGDGALVAHNSFALIAHALQVGGNLKLRWIPTRHLRFIDFSLKLLLQDPGLQKVSRMCEAMLHAASMQELEREVPNGIVIHHGRGDKPACPAPARGNEVHLSCGYRLFTRGEGDLWHAAGPTNQIRWIPLRRLPAGPRWHFLENEPGDEFQRRCRRPFLRRPTANRQRSARPTCGRYAPSSLPRKPTRQRRGKQVCLQDMICRNRARWRGVGGPMFDSFPGRAGYARLSDGFLNEVLGRGETGDPRENPQTSGMVRQDSHMCDARRESNPVRLGGRRVVLTTTSPRPHLAVVREEVGVVDGWKGDNLHIHTHIRTCRRSAGQRKFQPDLLDLPVPYTPTFLRSVCGQPAPIRGESSGSLIWTSSRFQVRPVAFAVNWRGFFFPPSRSGQVSPPQPPTSRGQAPSLDATGATELRSRAHSIGLGGVWYCTSKQVGNTGRAVAVLGEKLHRLSAAEVPLRGSEAEKCQTDKDETAM